MAESKFDDDTTYLVRKLKARLKAEAKHDSVKSLFDELDRNGDRRITAIEFRAGMKRLGMRLDDWEIREVIKHCDLDGDGEVSYTEFEAFINAKENKDSDVEDVLARLREIVRSEARYSYRGMQDVFEEFDSDYSGTITADELHRGLRKFKVTLTVAEADDIVRRFPGARSAKSLKYREFVAAIKGVAPASHGHKDVEGSRTASYAVRKLQEEIERCAKTRNGFDLRTVFREMDADRSGTLDRAELRAVLDRLGLRLSRSELIDVMDFFTAGQGSSSAEIPYEQFCKYALRQDPGSLRIKHRVAEEIARLSKRRGGRPPDYKATFEEMDKDSSGSIDMSEFSAAMRSLGLRLSSSESRQLMNMFDENGDGHVTYSEFIDFLAEPKN